MAGKIISSAAAATLLVGGLVTQLRPPSPPAAQAPAATPVVPTRLAHSGSSAPVFTYIEVDGQTLPVVLTENPTGNSSVGGGPASASPSLDLSGGGGRGPGAGSPHFGPRNGSPVLPGPGPGGHPPEASQPDGNPMPPPTSGDIPPLPRTPDEQFNCTPATVSPDSESPNALPPGARPCPTHLAGSDDPADNDSSEAGSPPPQGEPGSESGESPDNVAGSLPEAPQSRLTPGNDAGAPMSPLRDEPRNELLEPPFPGNAPSPFEAPESQIPTGMDDPLNPSTPLSEQPEPLLPSPYDGQSPPQTAEVSPAAVPEPSVIGLMLLGLAALGWTGRRRLTPTRRA